MRVWPASRPHCRGRAKNTTRGVPTYGRTGKDLVCFLIKPLRTRVSWVVGDIHDGDVDDADDHDGMRLLRARAARLPIAARSSVGGFCFGQFWGEEGVLTTRHARNPVC